MKHIRNKLVVLFALLLLANPLAAQDKRTLETKVADLLVQVPANDQQKLNEQMQSMLLMEEAGLQMIMDLVIPPGTGDDTKARMAIESLSRYLSQPDKESLQWEAMILKEIENRENPYVKSYFISQLNYFGSDASIAHLTPYLTDPKLQDPVIRAIRDIYPEKAADLFADRLQSCEDRTQIALVNAIKNIGNSRHADAVASLAGSDSPELQRSVLACLAKLGNPDSYGLLSDAAKNAEYMPEPTRATGSLLVYAQTLSLQYEHQLSQKICKSVNKKCTTPEQVHFKSTALITAAGNESIEKSVSLLVDAMKDKNKPYRMTAIRYAAANNTPVNPWVSALNSTKNNEVKAEILSLFGMLKSHETVNIVSSYMDDPDAAVRKQAVLALALIKKSEAVPSIVRYTLSYPVEPDSKTARAALLQTVGIEQLPLITAALDGAPEGAKVVLIEVIASRGDPGSFDILYAQIAQTGAVRTASLKNLYLVSDQGDLGDLIKLFDQLEDKDEMAAIETALVAAINRGPHRGVTTQALLLHAAISFSVEKYIGVLAKVGGKEALEAVYESYGSGDEDTRQRAFTGLIKSNDIYAASPLYEICSQSAITKEKEAAFRSYVRIVSSSTLPDDQKLLLLRKIKTHASSPRDTGMLIRAMGGVKTFLSFVTLSAYLEQEDLKTRAANALVSVVLPSNGRDNGLKGKLVKEKLIIARDIISGPDTEYLKIDIQNYLDKMPGEPGFVSMFNGTDLGGWQGLAADPVSKVKLSKKELQKLQVEANEKLQENWSVKDNCIVFNGQGSNLCSIKEYGSFEMVVDWRITKKGDSGIYLRGTPQVQIWDTTRVEAGAQVGSGGLYNNKVHESKPLLVADNPIGDWNTFRIIMVDERVTVYLNGQLVVDNEVMENYWDRSIPIYPKGSIELQAHGTDLAFRDIYIRGLDTDANSLSEEEKTEGFVNLFNGKDLSNWAGNEHSYTVEDGTIVIRPAKSGGNLFTEKEYADFIFRFEFKLTPGANNGLGIRTPMEGDAAYAGYELQILDNTAEVYAKLEPYQYHGSVYGIIPAKRGYLKPVGEWNSQEVYVKGDQIRITLNGTVIVDGDLKEATKNGTADHKEHPGLKRTSGHIGFLGHGSLLWFRNIRVKEL
jgi:HEAT repeat protein/predicted GNAT family N-acyltransferase